jgi:haloacetate dehalogenase
MFPEPFFPGFEPRRFQVDDIGIHALVGGSGPPLALVHGAPQSCVLWRHVAPRLAQDFTLVIPDLRGYGRSDKPEQGDYSKRRMAADIVSVMRQSGFERFALAGHDRGARVSRRLAKDHPGAVTRLAILDIAPTAYIYANVDRRVAANMWHWFFLIQRAPGPERLMGPQAELYIRALANLAGSDPDAIEDYVATNATPAGFHGMCEDYRAGAGIDLEHDAADADRAIEIPTLVLWGANSPSTGAVFDMEAAWRPEATDLRFASLPCGHFIPEEKPNETTEALLEFFR